MLTDRFGPARLVASTIFLAAVLASANARAQAPPPPEAAGTATRATVSLDAMSWLRGCWLGSVNRREFREQWSPPRGGMMVGFSHTVVSPQQPGYGAEKAGAEGKGAIDHSKDQTQDFEYLRLEQRADGIYYVAVPSGKKEVAFKLSDVTDDSGAKIFTFTNVVDEFPQHLVYRHGKEGWLYAEVSGKEKVKGNDVIYPMRHVDCATDALLKE